MHCAKGSLIALRGLGKHYLQGGVAQSVLAGVSLTVGHGETLAITGGSGSGKSTLLNILGLLDIPDNGYHFFDGRDMRGLSAEQLAAIRNRQMGFVFQSFNLLPYLSALDNVALPFVYRSVSRREALAEAAGMLERVGLGDRRHHRPADLSGGQRQRVAIARALVGRPRVILADEPTGNLDGATAEVIMDLLFSFNRERQTALIVVTHDEQIARRMGRQIRVHQGAVSEPARQ